MYLEVSLLQDGTGWADSEMAQKFKEDLQRLSGELQNLFRQQQCCMVHAYPTLLLWRCPTLALLRADCPHVSCSEHMGSMVRPLHPFRRQCCMMHAGPTLLLLRRRKPALLRAIALMSHAQSSSGTWTPLVRPLHYEFGESCAHKNLIRGCNNAGQNKIERHVREDPTWFPVLALGRPCGWTHQGKYLPPIKEVCSADKSVC